MTLKQNPQTGTEPLLICTTCSKSLQPVMLICPWCEHKVASFSTNQGTSEQAASQSKPFFSAVSVALATFLGFSPIGGAILVARNYTLAGNKQASENVLLAGVALTLADLVIEYFNNSFWISLLLILGCTFGWWRYTTTKQGSMIAANIQNNGKKGPVWQAIGLGIIVFWPNLLVQYSESLMAKEDYHPSLWFYAVAVPPMLRGIWVALKSLADQSKTSVGDDSNSIK